ncbi:MAG: ribosome recycling factor [Spirochaetales bacterium]|nr:MAG: ribosome recycling factor [Spirochaetales bacterium]
MDTVIAKAEERMKKTVGALVEEYNTLRTGRASSALFDKIRVDYYGSQTPLNQVSTISVPEARLVVIQPWDKAIIGDIEKAIQKSELSLNPSNDGKVIRISIPPLTEERRKEFVKIAKNMAEQSRVGIRNIRRDANDELKKSQKDGTISEDDLKRGEDNVQKTTDKYIEEVNAALESKEQEILEI